MDRLRFKDENNIIFPNPKLTKLSNVLIQGSKDKVEDTSKYKKITVMLNFKGIKFAEIEREMADTRPFYVRRTDEIIIGKQNYFNGSIALVSKEFDGTICSNAIMSFSVKQNSIPYFIYSLLSQNRFMRTREKLANGTGQKELSEKDFLNFDINLPSKQEQEKIGGFLSSFDQLIQKQQERIGLLRELKQGYLQQMFPTKGSKVPKIRFKGFTETWEQCELSELATFSKGSGYSKGDLADNGHPIILYGRLYTKYETNISEVDTFVVKKSGSVISAGGEVIVPASGETSEDIAIASVVEKPGLILGGDLNVIHPNEMIESTFLALSITYGIPHIDMAKRAQGKSVVHLHNSDLKKVILSFPKKEEQLKISQYFMKLDSLITLHQRKLEGLEGMKKGYIQRIFM